MTERWDVERAARWGERVGWLVGCNFSPSTAGNQLEMWQAATYDPETIDRELRWAAGLGMNAVRVYLHDLLWVDDADGFLGRMDEVLTFPAVAMEAGGDIEMRLWNESNPWPWRPLGEGV